MNTAGRGGGGGVQVVGWGRGGASNKTDELGESLFINFRFLTFFSYFPTFCSPCAIASFHLSLIQHDTYKLKLLHVSNEICLFIYLFIYLFVYDER